MKESPQKQGPEPAGCVPVILGPTASGKTRLAVRLAAAIGGEVISADSRQVYRGMDIGTGKDLSEYMCEGRLIPYHLIDIAEPGYEYNVYEFRQDFMKAYRDVTGRGRVPVLCGGSGMYIDALVRGYQLPDLPEEPGFLEELQSRSTEDLLSLYYAICTPHNTTDTVERPRIIKAIRIAVRAARETEHDPVSAKIPFHLFGILTDRERRRERITRRLKERLDQGLIAEVQGLLDRGVPAERLKRFGLEYRYVMRHLEGDFGVEEMTALLNTAIHQFAKRQMTWFRKMERAGCTILWLDEHLPEPEKIAIIRTNIFM